MTILPPSNVRRALRVGACFTLRDVTDSIGVSKPTVFSWERGARPRDPKQRAAYGVLLKQWAEQLAPGITALVTG